MLERPAVEDADVNDEDAGMGLPDDDEVEVKEEEADIGFVEVEEPEYANEDAVEDFGGIGGKPDEGGEAEVYDG